VAEGVARQVEEFRRADEMLIEGLKTKSPVNIHIKIYSVNICGLLQIFPVKEEEEPFIMKSILRYSRYTWSTWLVMKVFIKLSTYYMLKGREMEAEAHSWITDWGPLVNPFVNFVLWPLSRVIKFFYRLDTPFWDSVYFEYILPMYILYLQPFVEPPLFLLQDTSVRCLLFFFEFFNGMNYETMVFIIMFIFAIGDIASFYCHRKMKNLFKKEIELETFEKEVDNFCWIFS
jgi:hypothetical protein